MKFLRSHWYYWYTGQPLIAISSVMLTTLLLWGSMVWMGNYSVWGILLAVVLDSVGFWLALIYAVALRFYLPTLLVEQADTLIIQHLIIPLCASFVVARVVVMVVAKLLGNANSWLNKALWVILLSTLGLGGMQVYEYYQAQQTALEAKRQQLEPIKTQAHALAEAASKAVNAATTATGQALTEAKSMANETAVDAGKIANDTAASASRIANDTATSAVQKIEQLVMYIKAAWLEVCKKTADLLGKKPEDYCE